MEKVNTYQVEFDRVKNIKKEYDKNLSLPKENKEKGTYSHRKGQWC